MGELTLDRVPFHGVLGGDGAKISVQDRVDVGIVDGVGIEDVAVVPLALGLDLGVKKTEGGGCHEEASEENGDLHDCRGVGGEG